MLFACMSPRVRAIENECRRTHRRQDVPDVCLVPHAGEAAAAPGVAAKRAFRACQRANSRSRGASSGRSPKPNLAISSSSPHALTISAVSLSSSSRPTPMDSRPLENLRIGADCDGPFRMGRREENRRGRTAQYPAEQRGTSLRPRLHLQSLGAEHDLWDHGLRRRSINQQHVAV
jgi:hypothetical protein